MSGEYEYTPQTAEELLALTLSQQKPSKAALGNTSPVPVSTLPQVWPQPNHQFQRPSTSAAVSGDDDEDFELPIVTLSPEVPPPPPPAVPQSRLATTPSGGPTGFQSPTIYSAPLTSMNVSSVHAMLPSSPSPALNAGSAPPQPMAATLLPSDMFTLATQISHSAAQQAGSTTVTGPAPSRQVALPVAMPNTVSQTGPITVPPVPRAPQQSAPLANPVNFVASQQQPRPKTPQRQVAKNNTKSRVTLNSNFKSPSQVPLHGDEFANQVSDLNDILEQFPSSVVRYTMRHNWISTVTGSDYHMAFMLNVLLHQAAKEFARSSFANFGKTIVKICVREIMANLDTQDLDSVSDILLKKTSNDLMDKIMAQRLATIESRSLLNMLARAERLGYNSADVIEDGDEADDESDLDFGVDVVTSDVTMPPPAPPAPPASSAPVPLANLVPIPSLPVNYPHNPGSVLAPRALNPDIDPEYQSPPKSYLGVDGKPYIPQCPAGEPAAVDNGMYMVYFMQSDFDSMGFDESHKCEKCLMIFPSDKAKSFHDRKQSCWKRRHGGIPFGCRFCGTMFKGVGGLKHHVGLHTCGDYSHLGQSADHPNGASHLVFFTPPLAVHKSAFLNKRRKRVEVPPEDTGASHKRQKLPLHTPSPNSASTKSKVKDKTTTKPHQTDASASTLVEKPDSGIYDHLTAEEYNMMQQELIAADEKYNDRIAMAVEAGNKAQVDNLKNCRASKLSMVRKKYNVRLPRGYRYTKDNSIAGSHSTTGQSIGGEPKSNAKAGNSQTTHGDVAHAKHAKKPVRRDSHFPGQRATPTSSTTDTAISIMQKAREVAQSQSRMEQIGSSGLLADNSNGAVKVDPTMPVSGTSSNNNNNNNNNNNSSSNSNNNSATAVNPVYISSSDDSDSDDSIPAKLPRPNLN